jgi:hypothetical protein
MTTALQDSLFDPVAPIDRVTQPRVGHHHRNASKTETNAAKAIVNVSGGQRRTILESIVKTGWIGHTRQEIADFNGILLQSVCGRVKELLDAGYIYETRRERNGGAVLAATERGTKAIAA